MSHVSSDTLPQPFISLLDPALHTPASTFARCPFLFTVSKYLTADVFLWNSLTDGYRIQVCAISSRYYTEKSEIYPIAMHFAKHSAANALIDGWKSVELCQAYILMSIYAVPARRWEEDRSWLYAGLAIRFAFLVPAIVTSLINFSELRQIWICTRFPQLSRRRRSKNERYWTEHECGWFAST